MTFELETNVILFLQTNNPPARFETYESTFTKKTLWFHSCLFVLLWKKFLPKGAQLTILSCFERLSHLRTSKSWHYFTLCSSLEYTSCRDI